MNPTFSVGTLPVWRHPIRQRRSLTGIDVLSGDYKCARSTTLNPGDAVPGFPGMIIMDIDETDSGISHEYSIQAEGSLSNTSATKLIGRSEARSIGPNFETFTERRISWHTGRKAITGVASTDVINSTAHGLSDAQRIVILELTGGTGLTAQSGTVIGVVYFVRDATSDTFKLALTAGGAAVNFTTDISAGYILAAEFCPGTVHPDWSSMYLSSVSLSDNGNTSFRTAECTYVGKLWDKPYHRVITCNGVEISPSDPIFWNYTDGWVDSLNGSFRMPQIVVTDTFLSTATLPTSSIPLSNGEGGAPPNAPSVRSFTFTGADSLFRFRWPNGWTLIDTSHVDTLNSGIPVHIYRKTHEYIVAQMFK